MVIETHIFCYAVEFSVRNRRQVLKKLFSLFGVYFHDLEFFWSEFSSLVQNSFRDVNLSNVMEKGCSFVGWNLLIRENIRIVSVFFQLSCNYSNVGAGVVYVVSSEKVMASENLRDELDDSWLGFLKHRVLVREQEIHLVGLVNQWEKCLNVVFTAGCHGHGYEMGENDFDGESWGESPEILHGRVNLPGYGVALKYLVCPVKHW